MYRSRFNASADAERVLRTGNIISDDETPSQMIDRMISNIVGVEKKFGTTDADTAAFAQRFAELCDSKSIVMSTPVMTNSGRYTERPLTACTMPPVDLRGDLQNTRTTIDTLHQQGMGTGFNLDEVDDPVAVLRFLNKVAIEGADSGNEDRPVGNMAILSIAHPRIRDFIESKRTAATDGSTWKFNISVDVDDAFMEAVKSHSGFVLKNGEIVDASDLFMQICEAAHDSADPGLIFLNRMNHRNPTPGIGEYKTTAPCAEVGLAPGETCQFGYINLRAFIALDTNHNASLDYDRLAEATEIMVRALDDCMELSIDSYTTPKSSSIMSMKRKIGVGICGVADMLVAAGLPYDSPEGVSLVQDAIAWINYQSKLASVELAQQRGPALAMDLMNFDGNAPNNKHLLETPLIDSLFGEMNTPSVSGDHWRSLASVIRKTRMLRNVTTTALPPTGRSSLVIDASTGIEPFFSLTGSNGSPHIEVAERLRKDNLPINAVIGVSTYDGHPYDTYHTATEISPEGHMRMASGVQRVIDEAVSKTINLPEESSAGDIAEVYVSAWDSGMSGITVYRSGTHSLQPKKLTLKGDKS